MSNLFQLSVATTTPLKTQLLTLFIKAFKHRFIDSNEFASIIDVRYIYHFVAYYKRYIKFYIVVMSEVYCYCGLIICSLSLAVLDKDVINIAFFHYCS